MYIIYSRIPINYKRPPRGKSKWPLIKDGASLLQIYFVKFKTRRKIKIIKRAIEICKKIGGNQAF